MLKAQAQENISTFKPLHLLQPDPQKTQGKQVFIFCTNSMQSFWIKENQDDWEEVKIDEKEILRDGGSTTFRFNGKEFNQLYISSALIKETCHLSGDGQRVILEKIPLSKEKLQEIGITNQVKLDLSNIPETIAAAEKVQKEKLEKNKVSTSENLSRLWKRDLNLFFDKLSKDKEVSEPETSSRSEKLAKDLAN
ncbi:MAG: hypothetical protein WA659_01900 [Candidatus Aquirickettsiella sp.]